jgi:hypothetical protein
MTLQGQHVETMEMECTARSEVRNSASFVKKRGAAIDIVYGQRARSFLQVAVGELRL